MYAFLRLSLEALSTFLNACEATVLIARTATAALAFIETTSNLDAIITDLALPDMDGLQLRVDGDSIRRVSSSR